MAYIPKPGDVVRYTRRYDERFSLTHRKWYDALVVKEITPESDEAKFSKADGNRTYPCFLIKTKAGVYHERSLDEYTFYPSEIPLEVKWALAVDLLKQFKYTLRAEVNREDGPSSDARELLDEIDWLLDEGH